MAEVVDTARSRLPLWAQSYLPENTADVQNAAASWLREHASQLGSVGQGVGLFLFHLVIGLVAGGLIAVQGAVGYGEPGPLALALKRRVELLSEAFYSIVFSQIRISALNTTLTAIYLAIVLPLFDVHLPLVKTMIAVTFVAGLLPVLGNLISNTVIVIVSLSDSPSVAVAALIYLVFIHKLEYFVNARIIGSRIQARAWELLIAMVSMEAAFGLAGLVAAPIYYAYLKDELKVRGLL
jgi:predicted PurR-regulated permease PerM